MMDAYIVYVMADAHVQWDGQSLHVKDICQVYCEKKEIQQWIEVLSLKHVPQDENGRAVLSVLVLIEEILQSAGRCHPEWKIRCENLGAEQTIVEKRSAAGEKRWITGMKLGLASMIMFIGSAFTIMTYDQDVDVTGVFARIYQMVLGRVPSQPGILETTYALGVAAGILLFFNPFTASTKRKEPSPIEIEMEKYESDIQDTIVKMSNRKGSGR